MKSMSGTTLKAGRMDEESSSGRTPAIRSVRALALLATALIVAACQQVPSGHWNKPCGTKTGADCYGQASPPPAAH